MDPPERLVPYMDTPGGAFNLRRLFSPGLTAALRHGKTYGIRQLSDSASPTP